VRAELGCCSREVVLQGDGSAIVERVRERRGRLDPAQAMRR
jgi:hypothetical protein